MDELDEYFFMPDKFDYKSILDDTAIKSFIWEPLPSDPIEFTDMDLKSVLLMINAENLRRLQEEESKEND